MRIVRPVATAAVGGTATAALRSAPPAERELISVYIGHLGISHDPGFRELVASANAALRRQAETRGERFIIPLTARTDRAGDPWPAVPRINRIK